MLMIEIRIVWAQVNGFGLSADVNFDLQAAPKTFHGPVSIKLLQTVWLKRAAISSIHGRFKYQRRLPTISADGLELSGMSQAVPYSGPKV